MASTRKVVDRAQLRAVQREIEGQLGDYHRALRAALYEAGWDIMDASQEIVPVEWGTLKASGDVSKPTATDPVCRVSYGGPAVAYAAYQHEGQRADGSHLIEHHSETGKSTHYLQIPLEEELAEWPDKLVERIRAQHRR